MRLSPVFLSILLSSVLASFGQSVPQSAVQPQAEAGKQVSVRFEQMQLHSMTVAFHRCPIAFTAEREGSLGLRETRNPIPYSGPGLDLGFGTQRRIVEADITVYGWSNQLRMVPAAYPPETSESFVLKGTNDAPIMQSLVWMKRLGVVNSVELTRVLFSDGGTWTQSGDMHCTVVPSKLVLVGASAGSK